MNRNARWFALVVIAQAVFLGSWAGWHEYARSTAPVVRLKTIPVDPRDLLRGDYMILRYEISRVNPPDVADATRGAEFWVTLVPRDGYYAALASSWTEPVVKPGQYAVKAWPGKRGTTFGIEDFYVPEGKGTPHFKKLEVDAAVGSDHRLYIKQVLVDGLPYP